MEEFRRCKVDGWAWSIAGEVTSNVMPKIYYVNDLTINITHMGVGYAEFIYGF